MSQLYIQEDLVRIQPLVHKVLYKQESVTTMPTPTPLPIPTGSAPKSICSPSRRLRDINICSINSCFGSPWNCAFLFLDKTVTAEKCLCENSYVPVFVFNVLSCTTIQLEKFFFRKKKKKKNVPPPPPHSARVVILVRNMSSHPVLHLYQASSKYSVGYLG